MIRAVVPRSTLYSASGPIGPAHRAVETFTATQETRPPKSLSECPVTAGVTADDLINLATRGERLYASGTVGRARRGRMRGARASARSTGNGVAVPRGSVDRPP